MGANEMPRKGENRRSGFSADIYRLAATARTKTDFLLPTDCHAAACLQGGRMGGCPKAVEHQCEECVHTPLFTLIPFSFCPEER